MAESEIYKAILGVMKEVGYVQKIKAPGLNFSFAGEADLIAALRPAMLAHDLFCYVYDIAELRRETYQTKSGTTMQSSLVRGTVRFAHGASGEYIDVQASGEGADAGDKSANKAATGMLKYALRQTFLIETGDDPDKHSSDEQEQAVTANKTPGAKVGRPMEASAVLKSIELRAAKYEKERKNASDKQKGLAVGMLELCFAGDMDSDLKRHSVQAYLTGCTETSEISGPYWLALLDWLEPIKDSGGAFMPSPFAVQEAQRIIKANLIDHGQQELPV